MYTLYTSGFTSDEILRLSEDFFALATLEKALSIASSLSLSKKESMVMGVAFFFVIFLLVLSDAVDGDWSA